MDPVSALGVASAAVQFLDFSGTVVKAMIEVYRLVEAKDSWQDFLRLRANGLQLQLSSRRLKSALQPEQLHRQPTNAENNILAVVNDCDDISTLLLKSLKYIDPKAEGSKMDTLRAAVKTVWRKDKVETLQQRLSALREQLMLDVLINIRYCVLLCNE